MATITLDQIKADVQAKYEPFVVDLGEGKTCSLTQALRLPKEKRQHIAKQQDALQEIDQKADDAEDQMVAILADLITTAATDQDDAAALLSLIGDDMTLLLEIVTKYGQATQLPEASPSPS